MMLFGIVSTSYAEPLRDCTWYEIIHYDNGDGTASTPSGTCIIPRNSVNPSSAGDDLTAAIPNWVNIQFVWYVDGEIDEKTLLTSLNWMFDNNIMYLSQEAAIEVQEMRNEIDDLKHKLEETQAAIAIPNLLDARKGANESTAISSITTVEIPSMDGEHTKIFIASSENTDINAFVQWVLRESYLETNKDLQFYADKVRFYNELKSALETNPDFLNPDFLNPDFLNPDFLNPDFLNPDYESRVKVQFPWMKADFDFASETVDDILTKGGTASVWEDGIASFSQHVMSESGVTELEGIVVLFNNAIDKNAQSIDAELKILEQWLEMISKEQESSSYDASGRLTSDTTEATVQYRESDFNFISRTLGSIDQEIKALDTGIGVLEEKLQTAADMTQIMQLQLQDAMNKQQLTLQTLSNIMKSQHDTLKAIINNMR